MTIQQLITRVNTEKPNSFSDASLLVYVNEVEAEVAEQLRKEDGFEPHTQMTEELLAPSPYDRLYVSYVKAQIDYANDELESYANNQAQHVQDFQDFTDWVVRERKDGRQRPKRFRHVTRW